MAEIAVSPQPTLAAVNRAPAQLWLPHWGLAHCVRAVIVRSTVGVGRHWPEAWRYNHFPASPLCSVSWFLDGHAELLAPGCPPSPESPGQRMPPEYFAGPFTRPSVSRNSVEGQGLMLMLLPDAVQALTGLNPADWVNRHAPLQDALGPDWALLTAAVRSAATDAARVQAIEQFLLPRWRAVRPQTHGPVRLPVQDWVQGLAMRAAVSGVGRSLRQAERRIKGWAGLPLRELRGLGRAEQAFFHALAQGDGPVRWSNVAADAGYADQSHLSRETRRVTGFPPNELRQRIAEDESFWIYRLWI